jgi:dihydroxyacetone kinase-like predicted kinase
MGIEDTRKQAYEWSGDDIEAMFASGLCWLEVNQKYLNSVNVFPVPDGDTGTNLVVTASRGRRGMSQVHSHLGVNKTMAIFTKELLLSHRGNAGVIFSQFIRGIASSLQDVEKLRAVDLFKALKQGSIKSYGAVIKPIEGTMLTVIREVSEKAPSAGTEDLTALLGEITSQAFRSTLQTPFKLPILEQAGVVDAGGLGIAVFLEGALMWAEGFACQPTKYIFPSLQPSSVEDLKTYEMHVIDRTGGDKIDAFTTILISDYLRHCYRLSNVIIGNNDRHWLQSSIRYWSSLIDCKLDTYSPYIHLLPPDEILIQSRQRIFSRSIWWRSSTSENVAPAFPVIAMASGEGWKKLFQVLRSTRVVDVGSANRSNIKDLAESINMVQGDTVVLLPNSKAALSAARDLEQYYKTRREIIIVPTQCPVNGVAAMLALNPYQTLETNISLMISGSEHIKVAEIMQITQPAEINGVLVRALDFIIRYQGSIITSASTLVEVFVKFLELLPEQGIGALDIYYGKEVSLSQAKILYLKAINRYRGMEVNLINGGQSDNTVLLAVI